MKKLLCLLLLLSVAVAGCKLEPKAEKIYFYLQLNPLEDIKTESGKYTFKGLNTNTNKVETWEFECSYRQRTAGYGPDMFESIYYNGKSNQLFIWIDSEKEMEILVKEMPNLPFYNMSPPDSCFVRNYKQIDKEEE